MIKHLQSLALVIDSLNRILGKAVSWLTLLMAFTVFFVVISRSFFGSIAVQESVTYMHATVIMLCLAYTAMSGGHVRVDIFYRKFNHEGKAWVNACGAILFLLPFCAFLFAVSWQFVAEAWTIKEGSDNPGGIQGVFLLKSLLPIATVLLALQGVAEIIRSLVSLTFKEDKEEEAP